MAREVAEETGLAPADYRADPMWHCVVSGAAIAIIRILNVAMPAAAIRTRILATLAAQSEPELSAIHIVRDHHDFTAAMPPFVTSFIASQTTAA